MKTRRFELIFEREQACSLLMSEALCLSAALSQSPNLNPFEYTGRMLQRRVLEDSDRANERMIC